MNGPGCEFYTLRGYGPVVLLRGVVGGARPGAAVFVDVGVLSQHRRYLEPTSIFMIKGRAAFQMVVHCCHDYLVNLTVNCGALTFRL